MTERESLFSLHELTRRAAGEEITSIAGDGTEIVFCGDGPDGYIGWTPRETADANGYIVHSTPRNEAVLALINVAETARALTEAADAAPIPLSSSTAFCWDDLCRALARFTR